MDIKLLAVDLAWSGKTGYAIINQDFEILEVDVFKCHGVRKKDPIQDETHSKCWQIYTFTREMILKHEPTNIYYEVSNWCRSVKAVAGLKNAEASLVLGYLETFGASYPSVLKSITPNEWQNELGVKKGKKLKGEEHKEKIAEVVCDKFRRSGLIFTRYSTGVKEAYAPFPLNKKLTRDETDALAIAYVAMNRIKNNLLE